MVKKIALIIPANIRSHVLPSFYLADLLAEEYDIVYAVGSQILEELCTENNFKCFTMGGFRIGIGMEEQYLKEKHGKVSFVKLLQAYIYNELFQNRKKMYDQILKDWKPDLIILDVFMSSEYFVLNQYCGLKIAFFNPMPSIYNLEITVDKEKNTTGTGKLSVKNDLYSRLLKCIISPKQSMIQYAQKIQNINLIRDSKLKNESTIVRSKYTMLFKDVLEVILLPEEFEYKLGNAKQYQMYLGLCQRKNRVDTELDYNFNITWPKILKKKTEGIHIIYCSFGTFFEGADRNLLNFVRSLYKAIISLENIHLVCSINKYVIELLMKDNLDKKYISLFSRVPQTTVLENATAFITHGGMGSIKESIYYEVPMLVFPLDPLYDQNDNALKVEHHNLGIRGVFRYERVDSIKEKLKDVISNTKYRESLKNFNKNLNYKYSKENIRNQLKERFNI